MYFAQSFALYGLYGLSKVRCTRRRKEVLPSVFVHLLTIYHEHIQLQKVGTRLIRQYLREGRHRKGQK